MLKICSFKHGFKLSQVNRTVDLKAFLVVGKNLPGPSEVPGAVLHCGDSLRSPFP